MLFMVQLKPQSLAMSHEYVGPVLEGQTVYVQGWFSLPYVPVRLNVINISEKDIDVMVKKEVLIHRPYVTHTFFWEEYEYPDTVLVSPVPVTIPAYTTCGAFEGRMYITGTTLPTDVKFTFYLENDTTDDFEVIVSYKADLAEVKRTTQSLVFSPAFPNPAHGQVSFSYELPPGTKGVKLTVYSAEGQPLKEAEVHNRSGTISFNTQDLNQGIYFYMFSIAGKQVESGKFIIQR